MDLANKTLTTRSGYSANVERILAEEGSVPLPVKLRSLTTRPIKGDLEHWGYLSGLRIADTATGGLICMVYVEALHKLQ